jgi:Zn-dependent protease
MHASLSIPFSPTETASLTSQRFRLGTFFGIGLYVHWTFALLIAYVVYATWASGAGAAMVAFSVAQLLTVFVCVTLHEYGHALAARRYDVGTHDITLLPIGGVARLKRIPRVPAQEFVIAVAGPAVNVVIAAVLLVAIFVAGGGWLFESLYQIVSGTIAPENVEATSQMMNRVFDSPTVIGFALSILMINVILVVFNMIPAFPMDGGRVLRSLLAMVLPYLDATRWAQRIGVFCAVLMAAAALSSDPPRIIMVLIAGFIVFAGLAEVRQVEIRDLVDGLTVSDVMTDQVPAVRADMTADQLWQWWKGQSSQSAAVVGINGMLLGQIRLIDLVTRLQTAKDRTPGVGKAGVKAADDRLADGRAGNGLSGDGANPYLVLENGRVGWQITAMDMIDPNAESLEAGEGLEGLLAGGRQSQREFPVTDPAGRLVGWVNIDTVRERAAIARLIPVTPGDHVWTLDQVV